MWIPATIFWVWPSLDLSRLYIYLLIVIPGQQRYGVSPLKASSSLGILWTCVDADVCV